MTVDLRDGSKREVKRRAKLASFQWLRNAIVHRASACGSPDDIPESIQHMRDSSAPDK